jgi:hypothetical protein
MPSVLLIMSASRSGSTVLCNILGQAAGAFGLGELHRLWDSAALATRMCSCGEIVLNCPVWRQVLRACYGSADADALRPTFAAIERHRDGCTRVRHMLPIPRAFAPSLDQHLRAYRQALEAIYASIGAVTGCQVAVDASKLPAYARVLLGCRLDVRVLFLVRDARATAYSWRRRKRTSVRGRTFTTAQYAWAASAKEWLITNWAAERLARALPPGRLLRVRYEDLMQQPQPALQRIARWAGLAEDSLPFIAPDQVRLSTAHLIAGNQNRFRTGEVALRPDDEWSAAMPLRAKRWVTLLTWPLLRRYGYL